MFESSRLKCKLKKIGLGLTPVISIWYSVQLILSVSALPWCFAARRSAPGKWLGSLPKRCNAAAGYHGDALWVSLSMPMDCVVPLDKGGAAIVGEARLAMNDVPFLVE